MLLGGLFIVSFIFTYQKRKVRTVQEIFMLKESFTRTLLQSQLEIQEQTLKNISQEIHDNIGQALSLVKLNLFTIDPSVPESLTTKLEDTKKLVSQAIRDLRDLSHSMNTDFVAEKGLVQSIGYELEMISKASKVHTLFDISGTVFRLNKKIELIIFRIVQEVLNNIIKHANATSIQVKIDFETDIVELQIKDNGQGMDLSPLNQHPAGDGLGIRNMHNRAKMIGGVFEMHSTLNVGTLVKISLPKEIREEDDSF